MQSGSCRCFALMLHRNFKKFRNKTRVDLLENSRIAAHYVGFFYSKVFPFGLSQNFSTGSLGQKLSTYLCKASKYFMEASTYLECMLSFMGRRALEMASCQKRGHPVSAYANLSEKLHIYRQIRSPRCVSMGEKCQFFVKFCVHTKQLIQNRSGHSKHGEAFTAIFEWV